MAAETALRDFLSGEIDARAKELQMLSHKIWSRPELFLEEHFAASVLTDFLSKEEFCVQKGIGGLETSFAASVGTGPPHVAFLCEYDALSEIGHACGHNLIAEAGVAAGIGLKALLQKYSQAPVSGKLTVFGTPAEESGGGKVIMLDKKCFDGVDVVVMVHPTPYTELMPMVLSCREMEVTFSGVEAHACAFPWEGKNSNDAAVMLYTSLSLLRQQIKPSCRILCVIIEGGIETYTIPRRSVVRVNVRAPTEEETDTLLAKVESCISSAALATGCTSEIAHEYSYQSLRNNREMAKIFSQHASSLGFNFSDKLQASNRKLLISSDIGNVSQVIPAIHPLYSIGSALNHTEQFTKCADTPHAHETTLTMAKAMALTGWTVLSNPSATQAIKDDFLCGPK